MAAKKTFLLRIDPAMWDELEAWSADEFRSVNGQIEYILSQAIKQRRGSAKKSKTDKAPPAQQE
jgi:hypothetical protein